MFNKIICKVWGHPAFRATSCPFTMMNYLVCDKCGYTKVVRQMKSLLILGVIIALAVGIYNIIYKGLIKEFDVLDLSNKTWEEE